MYSDRLWTDWEGRAVPALGTGYHPAFKQPLYVHTS